MTPVLTITGSDNSGWSGLQLDLRVITDMGCHALTAATCIVMQNDREIRDAVDFPPYIVRQQIESIVGDFHPRVAKIGLVRNPDTVRVIAEETVGCRSIVVAPGIMSSNGTQLIEDETVEAIRQYLIPRATLLVLRQIEAERILGCSISTNEDMSAAARRLCEMGAESVMLRGARITNGRLVALLYIKNEDENGEGTFFSSYNIEGWQQHGVGGALSSAIATRLAMGDDVPTAISKAHEYVHSRIVYSVKSDSKRLRPADIYNEFMNLLTDNYQSAHDVAFYANRLNVTTRYLSQITHDTVSKTPKQIIADYLMNETRQLLENSRLSIKEISDALGFSSVALFCKFFRQQQGQTPTDYRLSADLLS